MSVSSEAVRALHDSPWDPEGSRVLVVGTGRMGRLAGEVMRGHGVTDLRIAGRTTAHAEALARRLSGRPVPWHRLESAIREADIVFCSTAAPHAVISQELVVAALRGAEPDTRKVFIDIAVPRDVEPAVRGLPGITVFDLDDLQERLSRNLTDREREVPAVESIVEDEVHHFEDWRHGAELRPVLKAMHRQSEDIRRREVARAMRHLKEWPPEVQAQFDAFSRSLVNKLLHAPTRRLRDETDPKRSGAYVQAARELFGLDGLAADDGGEANRESVA
jgi:glutamyl-tRNA reductase